MEQSTSAGWLDRPVDPMADHVLGASDAQITLVEYGSYACPHCRAANGRITEVRDRFGERLLYVFRHRPLTGSDIARRAAELVECARTEDAFWDAHIKLMTRSAELTEDDLAAVAADFGLEQDFAQIDDARVRAAKARVESDIQSSRASGVRFTPTFFINRRRYDGPWDESSFADAMLGRLGHRVSTAALDFASWGPSAGMLLLLATIIAVALANSPMAAGFEAFWQQSFGVAIGDAMFRMSFQHWINDGLLTVFFLVVGLEIKRELTVGHLASRRSAALPIAAAIGGMATPAVIFLMLIPSGPWTNGWGIPITTDTAFAIALIVMMGARVPVELRIFLTAAAIIDDIGAILVITFFYSSGVHIEYLVAAALLTAALAALHAGRVYVLTPYLLLGAALWACVYASGLHATLAGIVLAFFIPTRPPANLMALVTQANTIITVEAKREGEVLRRGPSASALRALDAIHDRIESPADRLLRRAGARSSYLVLPLFALANASVIVAPHVVLGRLWLVLAIVGGLSIGKPLGMLVASALAVWTKLAVKPAEYSWRQLVGAGAMAGIGFTMSLFIAGEAFPAAEDFSAAKIAIFIASIVSAIIGAALLWNAPTPQVDNSASFEADLSVTRVE